MEYRIKKKKYASGLESFEAQVLTDDGWKGIFIDGSLCQASEACVDGSREMAMSRIKQHKLGGVEEEIEQIK